MASRFDKIVESLKQTKEWDACENPDEIVRKEFPLYEKYSDTTILPFLKAALVKAARATTLEMLEGFVMGGADKHGTKLPVSWPVLLRNGKLVKIVGWSPTLVPRGPHVIKATGSLDPNFGNYKDVEIIDATPIENVAKFSSVALTIADESTWEHKKGAGDPVLVKGTINWINPLYEKDPDGNRGDPVPLIDPKGRPVFEAVLAFDGLVELHLRFVQQNKGTPHVDIEDFATLIKDVQALYPDDPENQAKFLQTALKGREVLGMGEVMNISERYTKDEVRTLPVYIRVTGLVEIPAGAAADPGEKASAPPATSLTGKVSTLDSGETPDEFKTRIREQAKETIAEKIVPEPTPTPKPGPGHRPDPETVAGPKADDTAANRVDRIEGQIRDYLDLLGKSPAQIGIADLKEAGIGEGSTDMLISVALKKVKEAFIRDRTAAKKAAKAAGSDGDAATGDTE